MAVLNIPSKTVGDALWIVRGRGDLILGERNSRKASRIMHLLDEPWILEARKQPCRLRRESVPGRARAKALRRKWHRRFRTEETPLAALPSSFG